MFSATPTPSTITFFKILQILSLGTVFGGAVLLDGHFGLGVTLIIFGAAFAICGAIGESLAQQELTRLRKQRRAAKKARKQLKAAT